MTNNFPLDPEGSPNSGLRRRASGAQRALFLFAILLFLAASAYLTLVVITRVDSILAPGSEIKLGPVANRLPLVDSGTSESGIGKERITILLLGLDTRPQQGSHVPSRTDTIVLLTMDPKSRTAGILSIPRDMWVTIPGYGQGRINEAFPIGGPQLAMRTVEATLGVHIQYYVLVDFAAFTKLIDILGGIEVDVPERLRQQDYSPDDLPYHFVPKDFLPGRQHMNGEDALAFARIRVGSSDLDRIRRQQLVMFAVMDKALDLKLLPIAYDLWRRYKSLITTNINDVQAAGLIKLAASISPNDVTALSLGAVMVDCYRFGAQVLCWDPRQVRSVVSSLFLDHQIREERAVIEVRNATVRPDMAANVVRYLTDLGLPQSGLYITSARSAGQEQSLILDFSGKYYTAQKLAEWLGLPDDRVRLATAEDTFLRSRNDADIVVILGPDARPGSVSAGGASGG